MDQFVDDLLTKERVCATGLKKLPNRMVLEDLGQLELRVSPLGEEIEGLDDDDNVQEVKAETDDEVVEVNGNRNGYRDMDSRNGTGSDDSY